MKPLQERIHELEELWGDMECRLVQAETGSDKERNIRAFMAVLVGRINQLEKELFSEKQEGRTPSWTNPPELTADHKCFDEEA